MSRLALTWLRAVGRPVAARAVPTWVGVAIVAGVVMGGNGMAPRDVVTIASSSGRALVVLGLAWLLLSSAAVRVGLGAPGTAYLRSLPGGPGWNAFAVVAAAAVVHLPWAAVWFAGGGVGRGAAAWLAMTAASLVIVAGAGRLVRHPRTPRWPSPWRALAGVHVRSLGRRRISALAVGAGMAALGGAFAALVIGHEATDARDAMIISGACASLALAASLIAATAAVAEADRQVEWLAISAAVPPATRRAARALVLVALGILAALVATAATRAVAPLPPSMLGAVALANLLVGAALGLGAVEVASRARRPDAAAPRGHSRPAADVTPRESDVDGARIVVGLVLLGALSLAALGVFHLLGLLAFLAIGAGLAAGGRS